MKGFPISKGVISGLKPNNTQPPKTIITFHSMGTAMGKLRKIKVWKAVIPIKANNIISKGQPRIVPANKKMGNTNEIMPIIEFLASKNAGMMSGCLMPMDGGEGKSYNT